MCVVSESVRFGAQQPRSPLWENPVPSAGVCIRNFTGHTNYVYSVAFNPHDPNEVLSGSDDNTLKLWDKNTGVCVAAVPPVVGGINVIYVWPV